MAVLQPIAKVSWVGQAETRQSRRERSAMTRRTAVGALRCAIPGAAILVLTGCSVKLPDCTTGLKKSTTAGTKEQPRAGQQAFIGIDGSGSMLGYAQASDQDVWRRVLQSINQGVLVKRLKPVTYRIGAGVAEGPIVESVTQAADPCFFKGCSGFRPVASSLETLWTIKSGGKTLPLRLLVSDLEVNQSDVTSLLTGIQSDLKKGASAGILGLKAPFTGHVFNANGQVIHKGKTNRPVFILATGPIDQVSSVLDEIKRTLALKGVVDTHISLLNTNSFAKTIMAQWASGIPANAASTGLNIRIEGKTYSPAQNADYQFVKLNRGAAGLSMATAKKLSGGTVRANFGIAELERLSTTGVPEGTEGMQIGNIEIAGSNLKVQLRVSQATETGLYRVIIPAGSLPEQWWLNWDRQQSDKQEKGEKTQGFLLLMTTLNREITGSANSPPAAAMCLALQN